MEGCPRDRCFRGGIVGVEVWKSIGQAREGEYDAGAKGRGRQVDTCNPSLKMEWG